MDRGYCFNEECFKMSRRKQGRPQHRRTQDSLEQDSDLLVCGDCQTSFPLQDIVHFIKHKKQFCDKENVDATDGACRKPGSGGNNNNNNNNNNELNGDRNDDSADDDEDDGGDVSKSLSRRDAGDDDKADFDDDSDDGCEDTVAHNGLVNGDKDEGSKTEEKSVRRDEKDKSSSTASSTKEQRPPLRQKQMADAESNTTHSEPSRFVCETCRSTYTSAWALLQHAQKEHGMKIYTSTSSSGGQHHLSPCSATAPIPNTVSPMELVVGSSPRSSMDHRSVSTGSGGSISPYPVHTPNPFASPFRLPLDSRLAHPNSLSPFSRSPNIDFDVINDSRLRPQLLARGTPGLDHPLFLHSHFDRARPHLSPALESHYDYYSMRLKQLANSPVVSQTRSPFPSPSQPHPPSITVPATSFKPDSPPADTSSVSPRRNSLVSPLALPPKQKACEFCGKHFRFQSNLVVHRRSHTGEKPYKCPQCPHACTQQSKLKRHMKTHSLKADGTSSPNGMSNHQEGDGCLDDDDDEDEDELDDDEDEDEEECEEEEEDIMEEEMNEEEREVLERMKETKKSTQHDPEPGEICHEAKRIKLEQSVEGKAEEDNLPSDLSMKSKPTESLLSEVMKKTGLNDIQTYNEAYKAALAESQEGGMDKLEDKKHVKKACLDGDDPRRTSSPKSPRHGVKRELEPEREPDKEEQKERLFLGATDLLGKSSKRDSSIPSVWSPTIESLPHNSMDPAVLYSRLHHSWFAENPARLFFPGYPPRFPHSRDLSLTSESHNGLNLSPHVATTSSALKPDSPSIPALFKPQHSLHSPSSHYPSSLHRGSSSSSSSPTGSLLLPNNNSGIITPPRKEHRRNDTCEFCGKVFKNCSNLTVHRRSHTGEKPYKCNLCSYACAQSSKLTRHMKTHGRLGKDVYTCKFCNMPFSVPSTLEKHMRKCVENRNAGILGTDAGDLSSDSNGEMSRQTDSVASIY